MFYFDNIENKKILKSDFIKSAQAFFTTKESVITPNVLSELEDLCQQNKDQIAKYLGINERNFVIPKQTHSDNIKIADINENFEDTDALVTNNPEIAIVLNFADCTPVIIYDEILNIGAITHAGWRGTASKICVKTVDFMIKNYHSNPKNMTALIGPAISMKNYQVQEDVYKKISNSLENQYNDYYSYDSKADKYNIDLKTVNFHQLVEAGLDNKRIDKCDYCTYDSNDIFFSYRKENGTTARHSAILKLENRK